VLGGSGTEREAALVRLHEMLLRIARGEVRRRSAQLQVTGPELDDLVADGAAAEQRYPGTAAHLRVPDGRARNRSPRSILG
jgi:hypothetical protein